MQGTVLTYTDSDGKGLIAGDDGERYSFLRADLQQLKPVAAGMRVDFRAEEGQARQIFLLNDDTAAASASTPRQHAIYMDVTEGHASNRHHLGMWGYFKKCMAMYINAHGRATRGEYWSFVLFSWMFIIAPALLGIFVAGPDFYEYGDDPSPSAMILFLLSVLVYIVMIIPNITVMIRRLHDLGQSGWIYLLSFIPYLGGLVLFVMSLLPGERGPNKYGPDPQASRPEYVARGV